MVLGGVTALALLLSLNAAGLVVGPPAATAPGLRLFDPPTTAEQELAGSAARADPRVDERLGDRHVFLGASLHTGRSEVGAAPPTRLLDVWFYDYGSDTVIWAILDASTQRVTQLASPPRGFQPPLAAVELERAVGLAGALEEVLTRFAGAAPTATAIVISGEGTSCPTSRCALVGYHEDGYLRTDFIVLVSLSEDRVLGVVPDGLRGVRVS